MLFFTYCCRIDRLASVCITCAMEDNDTTSEVHGMSSDHETDDVRQPRMTSINHKRLYRCHECHYVTDRKNNLKRHVMTMHERCSKSLECCDDIFPNKASLREHVIESHKEGYDCRMCGRSFCRKALLKRHITVHSGQKDYVCELCGYATSHKSNLDRHKRRHLPKELRYQYFKSLPLVHSSPFIPPFTIPMNYKHFTDKYTGCVDQDRSSIVPAIHQQYNRVTMSQIYNIEDNRHKTQSNSACAASGPTQNNTSDIMAHNGEKHANQERPKIWNPAISDNYRYSSPYLTIIATARRLQRGSSRKVATNYVFHTTNVAKRVLKCGESLKIKGLAKNMCVTAGRHVLNVLKRLRAKCEKLPPISACWSSNTPAVRRSAQITKLEDSQRYQLLIQTPMEEYPLIQKP